MNRIFYLFLLNCLLSLPSFVRAQHPALQVETEKKISQTTSRLEAIPAFNLPFSVSVTGGSEKDEQNRKVVHGLTLKGVVSYVSSVSHGSLSGSAGSGAAAASYAATGRISAINVSITQNETGVETATLTDKSGNFILSAKQEGVYTIFVNGTEYAQVRLKTKHETAKNSISNIR